MLLRVASSQFDDVSAWGLATAAGVPRLPAPGSSRCSRGDGPDLWLRTNSFEGPEEQCDGLRGRIASGLGVGRWPFFEAHPLVVKRDDFSAFADIVRSMRRKEHLTKTGFERLVRRAYGMNANGKRRSRSVEQVLAGSSETARGAPTSSESQFLLGRDAEG